MGYYKILSLQNKSDWSKWLHRLPKDQQDVYFTPEYYALYENLNDGKAQCFVFQDKDKIALYPFLINSINDLGYQLDDNYYDIQGAYGYNGIISSDQSASLRNDFFESFDQYCIDSNIVAEFSRFHPLINNQLFSQSHRQLIFDRNTITIDLNHENEIIRQGFSSSTKRAINKAYKNGLQTQVHSGKELAKERFLELYKQTMQRVDSIPYLFFNKAYFENLFQLPNLEQITVEYDNTIIASAICFHSNNYYHYHLGASDAKYLNLRPNNVIFERMIRQGQEKECKYLHLGGGNSGDENDGLYKFKKGFSKLKTDFYIGKKIHNEPVYKSITAQWQEKFPESYKKYTHRLLGYREI